MKAAASFISRCTGVKGSVRCKNGFEQLVVKYFTAWKRLSGDWDTSCGNTLISMLIAIAAIVGIPAHLRPRTAALFLMGDDYLGVYSFDHKVCRVTLGQALAAEEASYGITPEYGITDDPMLVSFISLGLWPRHNGGFQFVPHPGKQLNKLFVAARPVLAKNIPEYITALSISFWPVFWGWPLMMKFLKLHHITMTTKMANPHYYADMLTRRCRNVNWCAGFMAKYKIPFVATHFELGDALMQRHPVVDLMLAFESADPCNRM
jgi:hypothetical protein